MRSKAHARLYRLAITGVTLGFALALAQGKPTADAGQQTVAASPRPSADYSPRQVVRLVVDALARNDVPHANAGIATVFRFASPANRRITGPLARFTRMLHGETYGPMLNHQAAAYGVLRIDGRHAAQSVIITTAHGERTGYVFELSRQNQPPYAGVWMTDAVRPFEVGQDLRQARGPSRVGAIRSRLIDVVHRFRGRRALL